jgi:glyoxylase-like metal-dependent hydrolase (beta-lactamase superfamily II)
MIFKPYYHFETGCAGYLFGCGTLGRCAVVDVREEDVDDAQAFATAKGMTITHVIDTHVHADHRSAGPVLAQRAGAWYCLHESARVKRPFVALRDGQIVELGNTTIEVLHTPGHSPESISLLVTDAKRGKRPWFVLTGDTLFVGAVGRPDLRGHARESASALYDSLHQRLLTLSDDLEIYPGHFSGSMCGTGLSGKPSSTIGFERQWNPMLSLDRETLIDRLADVPPEPDNMRANLAFNRGEAVENVRA